MRVMTDQINKLRTRLNPIIAAGITTREQELIRSVREVTDGAMKAGQYGGSRMALGLEAVYRAELTQRGVLVWETMMQAVDGLHPYQPMELADDFKHFISEHLESSRKELAYALKNRSGKQSEENETFNERFEMRELSEMLLRSYGAQLDLWVIQHQTKLSEAAAKQRAKWMQKALDWILGLLLGRK